MACLVIACRSEEIGGNTVRAPTLQAEPKNSNRQIDNSPPSTAMGSGGDGGASSMPSEHASSTAMTASSAGSGGDAMHVGNPEYVTSLIVYAACEEDGTEVPFAANRIGMGADCERIVFTPAHNDDGDFYEVWGYFNWTTDNPAITIDCLNGEHDNFCWPVSTQDLFSQDPMTEPTALVTACAVNDCPLPRPDDCLDELCVSFTVESVVNIEGTWQLFGDTFNDDDYLCPIQDGRHFEDAYQNILRGKVNSNVVEFDIDDYHYSGTFLNGANRLSGTIIETMTLSPVGTWYAERI